MAQIPFIVEICTECWSGFVSSPLLIAIIRETFRIQPPDTSSVHSVPYSCNCAAILSVCTVRTSDMTHTRRLN